METVIVGHASGDVGVWALKTGERLASGRLHGAVIHLALSRGRLYAATDLGGHLVWDLRILEASRCELLRAVWKRVPVVWERGRPVPRAAPLGHRCWSRR